MNSVTAQAAELKLALEQLYKQAEEAKAPKFSYKPKNNTKSEPKSNNGDDDILSGSGWATAGDVLGLTAARAGKATTLAKAMGQEADPAISHPRTARVINSLLTGGLGALGGYALGGRKGALLGGGLGAIGGGLASNTATAAEIARVRNDYNKARSEGHTMDLAAANPNLSRWGALLPFGGAHRSGSVDALEQLAGRPAGSGALGGVTSALTPFQVVGALPGAGAIPGGIGLLGLGAGAASGYDAAARNQKLISELEKGGSSHDLKDYDDLTDDVPNEFKGAHGEMRRFISDTNNKKGKKMNEQAMKKSAAFAASLGHYSGTMHKRAIMETLKGFGNNALDYYKGLDPTAQAAILGGGVGAGVGGIGNALFGKRKKGVGILGRLGRGALAGGGIGALGGAGINEGAIRLGMHNSGLGRESQIGHTMGENEMPSQMANEYLGIGN